ncbi:MAG TPA: AAA family ATPase, partial [Ktedonobacteraceae bacterium]|nr:AAA family ATPase [Ktedonobacteraceae bacterium]
MWLSSIEINNIKSFADSKVIKLDKRMNILIGPNNAGKSVIIQALYLLQNPSILGSNDIRRGASEGKVIIGLEDIDEEQYIHTFRANEYLHKAHFRFSPSSVTRIVINQQGASLNI